MVWLSNSRLRLRGSYSCTKGGERSIRFGLLRKNITSPMSKVLIISTLRTGPLESSISDTELVILDISFSSSLSRRLSCPSLESLSVGDHYSDLSYLALRPILWLQPYCRIGATVLGATIDFPIRIKVMATISFSWPLRHIHMPLLGNSFKQQFRSDRRKLRAYTPAPGEQVPPQQLYSKSLSLATLSFVSDLSRFPSLASSKKSLFPLLEATTSSNLKKSVYSSFLAYLVGRGGDVSKEQKAGEATDLKELLLETYSTGITSRVERKVTHKKCSRRTVVLINQSLRWPIPILSPISLDKRKTIPYFRLRWFGLRVVLLSLLTRWFVSSSFAYAVDQVLLTEKPTFNEEYGRFST
ncbi:hypothetical protein VNO77_46873 [Canavalia gladiata]|uniref:Uncharacterized protein n=1 Tax=Canavalia gladiata TaxID=3824 RepID=A0AAN9PHC6_CANGL